MHNFPVVWMIFRAEPKMLKCFAAAFLVAPLACCEVRLNQSGCRVSVCLSVSVCMCVEIFFPTNPYLQAGLINLDEIWHDGRS